MADINIIPGSKLVKLLAAQTRNERIDTGDVENANKIITQLSQDLTPENRHKLAQIVGFTVDELQQKELDFLNQIADVKNIADGDKAMFKVPTGGIKAYIQARGATTARSYVADRQVSVETFAISARPAINIVDLNRGRVQMSDLIREANRAITDVKLGKVQSVLHSAISTYQSPFYGTGTTSGAGISQSVLDGQIAYFSRLGRVTLLGDQAAVGQLASLTGMAMDSTPTVQRSDSLIDEYNDNGFIGKYKGANVLQLVNAYKDGTTTPILDPDWIYILPTMPAGSRNLKVVNEGNVTSFDSQNIDDMTYEIRLDQMFGVAFVTGKLPTMGCYEIN